MKTMSRGLRRDIKSSSVGHKCPSVDKATHCTTSDILTSIFIGYADYSAGLLGQRSEQARS